MLFCVLIAPAVVPCWSEAMAGQWWRWAGHVAMLGHASVAEMTAVWKGAWWRKIVEVVLCSAAEPSCGRLGRGHSLLGKRPCDGALQRTVEACLAEELLWHEIVEGRDQWRSMEREFVRRVLRRHD